MILSIDHVQLAIPRASEDIARKFYGDILGFEEIENSHCVLEGDVGSGKIMLSYI